MNRFPESSRPVLVVVTVSEIVEASSRFSVNLKLVNMFVGVFSMKGNWILFFGLQRDPFLTQLRAGLRLAGPLHASHLKLNGATEACQQSQ